MSFMPGQQLSRLFYDDAVRPILEEQFPKLRHSAGLLGTGSDALGFDTERSMDHHWGPRVWLFLSDCDYSESLASQIRDLLAQTLPFEIHGFPTHFVEIDPINHTVFMAPTSQRPINHMV